MKLTLSEADIIQAISESMASKLKLGVEEISFTQGRGANKGLSAEVEVLPLSEVNAKAPELSVDNAGVSVSGQTEVPEKTAQAPEQSAPAEETPDPAPEEDSTPVPTEDATATDTDGAPATAPNLFS